ncbi:DUF3558 domain-containing protein [Streptomyces sp. NPDC048659]|uniref:DUF3558 domain-containing protein n=1 Tax=Streptomyces sp. NPDC048659 TaxID=3155489 RepID=UPI0034342124
MQRKAYASGRTRPAVLTATAVVLGLGLGLSGCTSGPAADVAAVDSKAGPASAVAPPGRYRTLFEPCGAVPQATLKDLLPGAAALPEAERDRAYRGTAAVTFDTDRRVGCAWKADSPDVAHRLTLDIERVVSYDPAVSDDDRAQEVYAKKQTAAGIPLTAPTTPPATTPATAPPATAPPGTAHGPSTLAASGKPPSGPATPATVPPTTPPATSATGLEPRMLSGLGDVAFVDDVLTTTGPAGAKRLVSVVFRTSNVIVTVAYEEQSTSSAEPPDSGELQERARNLARLLAERLEE